MKITKSPQSPSMALKRELMMKTWAHVGQMQLCCCPQANSFLSRDLATFRGSLKTSTKRLNDLADGVKTDSRHGRKRKWPSRVIWCLEPFLLEQYDYSTAAGSGCFHFIQSGIHHEPFSDDKRRKKEEEWIPIKSSKAGKNGPSLRNM